MKKIMMVLAIIVVAVGAFGTFTYTEDEPIKIPSSPQRKGGDPLKGYDYLVNGDYVKGGIPLDFFLAGSTVMGMNAENQLKRSNINKSLPYEYTAITATNDEILVAPNCLQCHGTIFESELIIGLGNASIDFTAGKRVSTANMQMLEGLLKKNYPSKYEASASFLEISKVILPYLVTSSRGVNPADHLAAVLAAHRDPVTFKWSPVPSLPIPPGNIPTDTPPWWHMKKKNAMFYNGFGRGDFGRFLMASNLLTVKDTTESVEVDSHMPDVLAYIQSIKPPAYKKEIDKTIALQGKQLFENNCSKCHGTYDAKWTYPNLLIPQSIIGTDSFLNKSNYSNPQFIQWFNKSWFTTGDHPARLEPFNGYIAPPLDGIWITAPYLHNGSVPTLDDLLNSSSRPTYWSRDFKNQEYDYEKVGWKFKVHESQTGPHIYNTTLKGYGNYGHYFGDVLNDQERKAVIEYLKTL